MSKFAKSSTVAQPIGVSTAVAPSYTHEGGQGYQLDDRSAFFSLVTGSFVAEDGFYESGDEKIQRLRSLVKSIASTKEGSDWLVDCIVWLRDVANIRTAAIIAAAEYAIHRHPDAKLTGRQLIKQTLLRADEPAELLAYWISVEGKPLPYAIKRGVADAAVKLYNEFSTFKYNSSGHKFRPADVIELTHPIPENAAQSDLFRYLLETRHNNPVTPSEHLAKTFEMNAWFKNPDLDNLPEMMTWEAYSSATEMNAKAWETILPRMGYMARLRNLRNFDEANISDEWVSTLQKYLADPDKVANSRQLPFRFYSAFKNAGLKWSWPLEQALRLSVSNVPNFGGKTLILVDTSSSMGSPMSPKSSVACHEAGALFGAAVAARSEKAWLYQFASTTAPVKIDTDILKTTDNVVAAVGQVGHGTDIWGNLKVALSQITEVPDRVLIFTDMQAHPSYFNVNNVLPANVPVHVWGLGGYKTAIFDPERGRYFHAGLTDQSFKTIWLLEQGKNGQWPWEVQK